MNNKKLTFEQCDDGESGYIFLSEHPGPGTPGCVSRQIRLLDVVKYEGSDIMLDFDDSDRLIGIEIIGD